MSPVEWRPEIWGPHYWFFLHTVAHTYPEMPNAITKRKYYDLVMNMPLFLPDPEMGSKFAALLDNYPVSPYLASRESFVLWMVFIHNKVSEMVGRDSMTAADATEEYFAQYRAPAMVHAERFWSGRRGALWGLILFCLVVVFLLWRFGGGAAAAHERVAIAVKTAGWPVL